MPKATVFRLLRTLEGLGYLEYESETETYRLTERLRQLGEPGLGPLLARLARPAMTRLVAEFEQTVNLAVVEGGQLIYKDVQEGLRAVRMRPIPGAYLSWDKTALGKAVLAFQPRDQAIALLRLSPEQASDRARQLLWDELSRVRTTGFALDLEESEEGLCCVAAAILGRQGAPAAAVSVSGSASVLTTRALPRIGARLVAECSAVSAALGYQGDAPAYPAPITETVSEVGPHDWAPAEPAPARRRVR